MLVTISVFIVFGGDHDEGFGISGHLALRGPCQGLNSIRARSLHR